LYIQIAYLTYTDYYIYEILIYHYWKWITSFIAVRIQHNIGVRIQHMSSICFHGALFMCYF